MFPGWSFGRTGLASAPRSTASSTKHTCNVTSQKSYGHQEVAIGPAAHVGSAFQSVCEQHGSEGAGCQRRYMFPEGLKRDYRSHAGWRANRSFRTAFGFLVVSNTAANASQALSSRKIVGRSFSASTAAA